MESVAAKQERRGDRDAMRIAALEAELADALDMMGSWQERCRKQQALAAGWRDRYDVQAKRLQEAEDEIQRVKDAGQTAPSDARLERELIGGMLHWTDDAGWVLERLDPMDFWDPYSQFWFEQLREARAAGVPLESKASVVEWMWRHDLKQRAVNAGLYKSSEAVAEDASALVSAGCASRASMRYAAQRLRELRIKRAEVFIALELVKMAGDLLTENGSWLVAAEMRLAQLRRIKQLDATEGRA